MDKTKTQTGKSGGASKGGKQPGKIVKKPAPKR